MYKNQIQKFFILKISVKCFENKLKIILISFLLNTICFGKYICKQKPKTRNQASTFPAFQFSICNPPAVIHISLH